MTCHGQSLHIIFQSSKVSLNCLVQYSMIVNILISLGYYLARWINWSLGQVFRCTYLITCSSDLLDFLNVAPILQDLVTLPCHFILLQQLILDKI